MQLPHAQHLDGGGAKKRRKKKKHTQRCPKKSASKLERGRQGQEARKIENLLRPEPARKARHAKRRKQFARWIASKNFVLSVNEETSVDPKDQVYIKKGKNNTIAKLEDENNELEAREFKIKLLPPSGKVVVKTSTGKVLISRTKLWDANGGKKFADRVDELLDDAVEDNGEDRAPKFCGKHDEEKHSPVVARQMKRFHRLMKKVWLQGPKSIGVHQAWRRTFRRSVNEKKSLHLGLWKSQGMKHVDLTRETKLNAYRAARWHRYVRREVMPLVLSRMWATDEELVQKCMENWYRLRCELRELYRSIGDHDLGPIYTTSMTKYGATEFPHIDWNDPKSIASCLIVGQGNWEGAALQASSHGIALPMPPCSCTFFPSRTVRHCSTPFEAATDSERTLLVLFMSSGMLPRTGKGKKSRAVELDENLGGPSLVPAGSLAAKIIYEVEATPHAKMAMLEDLWAMGEPEGMQTTGFWAGRRQGRTEGEPIPRGQFWEQA